MLINKNLLYSFLLEKDVPELKMNPFQSWLDWYLKEDLINLEIDEKGNIKKALFIRKLYDEDVENFPLHANINMGDIEKTLKFYTHRPDGNIYYIDLLINKDKNYNNYIFQNYKFGFLYLIKRFNFNPYKIKENEKLIYFKEGRKTITNFYDHQEAIITIIKGDK